MHQHCAIQEMTDGPMLKTPWQVPQLLRAILLRGWLDFASLLEETLSDFAENGAVHAEDMRSMSAEVHRLITMLNSP
jgi:hypothetical protein